MQWIIGLVLALVQSLLPTSIPTVQIGPSPFTDAFVYTDEWPHMLMAVDAPPPPPPSFRLPPPPAAEVQAAAYHVDLPDVPSIGIETATSIALNAGWSPHLLDGLMIIARCEAGAGSWDDRAQWVFYPGETGDSGRSLGWLQLNEGHFQKAANNGAIGQDDVSRWYDPDVAAKVALWLYNARGQRFAGPGGWSCADKHGIYP